MLEIFEKMMAKDFDENMMLSEAYAILQNTNSAWVMCDDCTIKEKCHRICDMFVSRGINLDNVPLEDIGKEFNNIKFEISYPPEYLKLLENLKYVKNQKNKLLAMPHANQESIGMINSQVQYIENKIKEYHG